jgi:hypothetical protein
MAAALTRTLNVQQALSVAHQVTQVLPFAQTEMCIKDTQHIPVTMQEHLLRIVLLQMRTSYSKTAEQIRRAPMDLALTRT